MVAVPRVSLVFRRHAHHSGWSGYPRFADYLDGLVDARRAHPAPLPRRMLERVSGDIVYEWFGPDQLGLDLTAARRLALGRREVVHLLYGETDHFYAGRVRPFARRRGNQLVATFHQPPALIDELLPAPPLFEQLDHALALGTRAAEHLRGVVGAERVWRATHAVDTRAWTPRADAAAEVPTCSFVGSWFRDFPLFAEVVRRVRAAEPRVRFEAVTSPARVDELSALPGVTARARVSDDELRAVYRRSWVSVLPLSDAVANNALLEAMACGVATVVSEVGDVPDYSGGSRGARLVPPGDADAMADAVLALLRDRSARERLGARGRAEAERLDVRAGARRHADIYEEISRAATARARLRAEPAPHTS
jgi:glycosyltransferase involved in cell wall biosynthesis